LHNAAVLGPAPAPPYLGPSPDKMLKQPIISSGKMFIFLIRN